MSYNLSKKGWHAGRLASIDEETTRKFNKSGSNVRYSSNYSPAIKRGRSFCLSDEDDDVYVSTKIAIDAQSEQAIYNKATSRVRTLRRFKSDKVRPVTTLPHSPLLGLARSHTMVYNKSKETPKINRRNTVSPDKSSQKVEAAVQEANQQIPEKDSLLCNGAASPNDELLADDSACNDANSTVCVVSPVSTKENTTADYNYSASSEASSGSPSPPTTISGSNNHSSSDSENANYKSPSDINHSTSTDSHYSSLYRNHSYRVSQNRPQYYTSLYSKDSSNDDNNVYQNGRPILLSISSADDFKDRLTIETVESRSMRIKRPYFTILTTCVVVAYFILTMVYNFKLTGHPIQLSPFNIMVGPSKQTLIYTGARYIPCIKPTQNHPTDKFIYTCPYNRENQYISKPIYNDQTPFYSRSPFSSDIDNAQNNNCNLQAVCGGPTFAEADKPDQGYRFISTLFMHSGVLQLLLNLSAHILLGISIETRINVFRYSIIWLASGIFGYIFSSNFVPEENVSVGCSVSLMGVLAFVFIDTVKSWENWRRSYMALCQIVGCFVVCLAIGLLPGYDNFAHLGGFIGGVLVSLVVLPMHSTNSLSLIIDNDQRSRLNGQTVHLWLMRFISLSFLAVLIWIILYIFFNHGDDQQTCKYCQYFSCIPISDICSPYN